MNDYLAGEYTSKQVNGLIRDLKLIAKPHDRGDKINVDSKCIQPGGTWTSLTRTFVYTDEDRSKTVDFIQSKLDLAFLLILEYIPKHGLHHNSRAGSPENNAELNKMLDREYINRIATHIHNTISGIKALMELTYADDDDITGELEAILLAIKVRLEQYKRQKNDWGRFPDKSMRFPGNISDE